MTSLNNFNSYNISLGNVPFNYGLMCLILIVYVIIGIILLAAISQILDTEADLQARQIYKPGKPTIIVDLTYTVLPFSGDNAVRKVFVYDRLDPTGAKMDGLFAGSGYDIMYHNGRRGYSGLNVRGINANRELPVIASSFGIRVIENGGGAILSNGLGIRKEVSLLRQGQTGSIIRLCVLENQ